jgi:thioredoxin 1
MRADSSSGFGPEPSRPEVDQMPGLVLLEFGTNWCGYCQSLDQHLPALLQEYPQVRLIRVEDGPGRPLGRSFRVKLWPNLVFLRDGKVVSQLARPGEEEVRQALAALSSEPMDRAR